LDERVARTAARLFIDAGDCRRAHGILEAALDAQWSEALILLYGECQGEDVLAQIEHAEQWLKSRPRDRALLQTLGCLCMSKELWGKAQSYLDASISVSPSHAAYQALGQLAEQSGKADEALKYYQQAAALKADRADQN